MKSAPIALCAAALLCMSLPCAAKMVSAKDRARAEAECACCRVAEALCPDAIPDEGEVTACRSIFDRGIRIAGVRS